MAFNERAVESAELLRALPPELIRVCFRDGRFRLARYPRRAVVHFAGERCESLELLLEGQVAVERIDEDGRLVTIAELGAGDILGGNLLYARDPAYPMTVTARQDTVLLRAAREPLFALLAANPPFLRAYLQLLADNAAILGDRVRHYAHRTIRQSVSAFLEYEQRSQHTSRILLPMSKRALAEKIGVQRTSLSRELAKMKRDGLIDYDARTVTLLRELE